jgi:hypothetical protein
MTTAETRLSDYTSYSHQPIDLVALSHFYRGEIAAPVNHWEERLTVEQYAINALKRGISMQEVHELFGNVVQGPLTEEQAALLEERAHISQQLGQATLSDGR